MAKPDCEKCGGDGWYFVPMKDIRGEHELDAVSCECEEEK